MPPDFNDHISQEELQKFVQLGQVGWKYLSDCIFKQQWNPGLYQRILLARRFAFIRNLVRQNEQDEENAQEAFSNIRQAYDFEERLMLDFDKLKDEIKNLYEIKHLKVNKKDSRKRPKNFGKSLIVLKAK